MLAECSYGDVVFNGCTCNEGIGAPSVSHAGGYNVDFRYLRKDLSTKDSLSINSSNGFSNLDVDRQNKFIAAIRNFGWSSPCGHNPNNNGLNVHHLNGHGNHLHCQGFNIAIESI